MGLIRQRLRLMMPPRFWRRAGQLCLRLLEARTANYAVLSDPAGHLSGRASTRPR
ncbi:hypothetical protein [Erwinia sp. SLM-02]|uniref:hypothetical protein n=1 Tax=Erwinia sp. SLM-02 TaxID=3020057 RepID=UPI00308001D1